MAKQVKSKEEFTIDGASLVGMTKISLAQLETVGKLINGLIEHVGNLHQQWNAEAREGK